jgi:ABC-type antimicrobial peptide transport system permease subunit
LRYALRTLRKARGFTALGATRGQIAAALTRRAGLMIGVGLLVGMAAAFFVTRVMQDLLFGVTAHNPVVFASAVLVLLGAAAMAMFVPAREAMKVDPIIALRAE